MKEEVQVSQCPRCGMVVAPVTAYCPRHAVAMMPSAVAAHGSVVSFTMLHSPPQGFRSPLQIALVKLDDGGRVLCHGDGAATLRIGARVALRKVESTYYVSSMDLRARASMVWRRTRGWMGDRLRGLTAASMTRRREHAQ